MAGPLWKECSWGTDKVDGTQRGLIRTATMTCKTSSLLYLPSAAAGVSGMYSVDVGLLRDTRAPERSIFVLRQVFEQTLSCW